MQLLEGGSRKTNIEGGDCLKRGGGLGQLANVTRGGLVFLRGGGTNAHYGKYAISLQENTHAEV